MTFRIILWKRKNINKIVLNYFVLRVSVVFKQRDMRPSLVASAMHCQRMLHNGATANNNNNNNKQLQQQEQQLWTANNKLSTVPLHRPNLACQCVAVETVNVVVKAQLAVMLSLTGATRLEVMRSWWARQVSHRPEEPKSQRAKASAAPANTAGLIFIGELAV